MNILAIKSYEQIYHDEIIEENFKKGQLLTIPITRRTEFFRKTKISSDAEFSLEYFRALTFFSFKVTLG